MTRERGSEAMNCVICGKEFTPRRSIQKYCSAECRRYANRHGVNDIRAAAPATAPVIREFRCLKCGTIVRVRDHSDGRMKFCSQHCTASFPVGNAESMSLLRTRWTGGEFSAAANAASTGSASTTRRRELRWLQLMQGAMYMPDRCCRKSKRRHANHI